MKGIVFSDDMVRAWLNTQPDVWPAQPIDSSLPWKWQTRRVMKPQPTQDEHGWAWRPKHAKVDKTTSATESLGPLPCVHWRDGHNDAAATMLLRFSPYGKPGDVVYLKEMWKPRFHALKSLEGIFYKADGAFGQMDTRGAWKPRCDSWRSPRFMPYWASRLNLEVKAVRVERVQEIGRDGRKAHDVLAEGVSQAAIQREQEWFHLDDAPAIAFSRLWDSLNAKRGFGWESNPWVWVYELMPTTRRT